MEVVHIENQTKQNAVRVTKSIGALLVASSLPIESLTNETITLWVETNQGNNIDICKSTNLQHFILASVFGDTTINGKSGGISAVCEIANMGNIGLEENESIKFNLENLKSTATYTFNGIQYPVDTESLITFDRKTILQGETEKEYQLQQYTEMVISNTDALQEIEFVYNNGASVKYDKRELEAMSYEMDNEICIKQDGTIQRDVPNTLVLDVTHMVSMEILKTTEKDINITFRIVAETLDIV